MKAKEELNALKEEVEALNKKLAELTEEEITQITDSAERFSPRFVYDVPCKRVGRLDQYNRCMDRHTTWSVCSGCKYAVKNN